MAVRVKKTVLETAYKHFKEFELPLDIDYKSYSLIIGRGSIHPMTVKRSFKAWKYLTHALRVKYPELSVPKPAPKPEKNPVIPNDQLSYFKKNKLSVIILSSFASLLLIFFDF